MVGYLRANGVPGGNIITIVNAPPDDMAGDCMHDRRVEIMLVETRQVEIRQEPVVVREPEPIAVPEPIIVHTPIPPVTPMPPVVATDPDKQTVAVYMAGEEPQGARGVHNIMGGELARILSESDRYLAVDRTDAILEQLAREHIYQRSGAVDDDQIKALGQQLGVQYLCISDINAAGRKGYYLDVRLVDVVTAEIMRSVTATSRLRDANEMTRVARTIAYELIEPESARQQRLRRKKIFRYTAIGLDILGIGALAYGYFENNNVVKYVEEVAKEPEADRAATRRNAAYIVGGTLLVGGITIHILF